MKTNLERMLVPPTASVMEALHAINDGGAEVAFVSDETRRVIGLLTDGDLRRALLRGLPLSSRSLEDVMTRNFVSVRAETGRAEVLDIMRARKVDQIPVLDEEGRLVALHLLREFVTPVQRPNWAVIMAGGKGERLRPITEAIPKPMVRVAGVPILERLVHHLVGVGIQRIFIAVNYLGHQIEEHFGDGSGFGIGIEYLREQEPLGTGGALSLLPEPPAESILLLNGDLITQLDFGAMLDLHNARGSAITMGVKPYSLSVPYGVAEVQDGRLVELREKPVHRMLVNAGIYTLDPATLAHVPPGRYLPITELIQQRKDAGDAIGVHVIEEDWIDIGQPEQLSQARGQ